MKFILMLFSLCSFAHATYEKSNWNGVDVHWIVDEQRPRFYLKIFFDDGALSDHETRLGETQALFDLYLSGTNTYSKSELSNNLEFYGVEVENRTTHEYSEVSFAGLVKDAIPTMKILCHVFRHSIFPQEEVEQYLAQRKSEINNIVISHSALADRAHRQLSLVATGLENPVEGKISTLGNIDSNSLRRKNDYFQKQVNKKIFLYGPRELMVLKNVITNDCAWTGDVAYISRKNLTKPKFVQKPAAYLVTVPNGNQAQIRIGKMINPKADYFADESLVLAGSWLGGGFTSLLMEDLRQEKGLTYSVSALAATQASYGRSIIATSTNNEQVNDVLDSIKNLLENISQEPSKKEVSFKRAKTYLVGNTQMLVDAPEELLERLTASIHQGRTYEEMMDFSKRVDSKQMEQVEKVLGDVFGWNEQTIVIVAPKEISKKMKLPNVEIIDYKKLL
ncbi:MAG: insulinase family protein [Bacteriovoracaceae bacterium]|nr:insulinase family protein [Bacteriovoracaceae bacterium]